MIKLPPAVQGILDTLYGPDKWWRVWAMIMTVCVILWIPRSTRRLGALSFVGIGVAAIIWHYLQAAYKDYTPSDTGVTRPTQSKKWLK